MPDVGIHGAAPQRDSRYACGGEFADEEHAFLAPGVAVLRVPPSPGCGARLPVRQVRESPVWHVALIAKIVLNKNLVGHIALQVFGYVEPQLQDRSAPRHQAVNRHARLSRVPPGERDSLRSDRRVRYPTADDHLREIEESFQGTGNCGRRGHIYRMRTQLGCNQVWVDLRKALLGRRSQGCGRRGRRGCGRRGRRGCGQRGRRSCGWRGGRSCGRRGHRGRGRRGGRRRGWSRGGRGRGRNLRRRGGRGRRGGLRLRASGGDGEQRGQERNREAHRRYLPHYGPHYAPLGMGVS